MKSFSLGDALMGSKNSMLMRPQMKVGSFQNFASMLSLPELGDASKTLDGKASMSLLSGKISQKPSMGAHRLGGLTIPEQETASLTEMTSSPTTPEVNVADGDVVSEEFPTLPIGGEDAAPAKGQTEDSVVVLAEGAEKGTVQTLPNTSPAPIGMPAVVSGEVAPDDLGSNVYRMVGRTPKVAVSDGIPTQQVGARTAIIGNAMKALEIKVSGASNVLGAESVGDVAGVSDRGLTPAGRVAASSNLATSGSAGREVFTQVMDGVLKAAKIKGGVTVNLRPAELGRVEIRINKTDAVHSARIIVDRQDVLDLIRLEVRTLERSLIDGGFDLKGGSIDLSLRGGERGNSGAFASSESDREVLSRGEDEVASRIETAEEGRRLEYGRGQKLNIEV